MFAMMRNMGLDCVRRTGKRRPDRAQEDDRDGGSQLKPPAPREVTPTSLGSNSKSPRTDLDLPAPVELTPAELDAALNHLTRLQATLNAKLTAWKTGNIRRYQVAYLWLQCGFRNAEIADALSISRSAISQQMQAIRQELLEAARPECEEIARTINEQVGQELQRITTGANVERLLDNLLDDELDNDLDHLFDQVLYNLVLERYRRLLQQAPELYRLAGLLCKKQVAAEQLPDRMECTSRRIAWLRRKLEHWRQSSAAKIAGQLASECGIAADGLHEPVGRLMIKWFGGVTPDALAIQDADKERAKSARRAES
jgi:predicted transcriptional regulator